MIAAIYARKSREQSGVAEDEKSVTRQGEHARRPPRSAETRRLPLERGPAYPILPSARPGPA